MPVDLHVRFCHAVCVVLTLINQIVMVSYNFCLF